MPESRQEGKPREQAMNALTRANEVRLARARRHREIRALDRRGGLTLLAEWLRDPPEELLTAEIGLLVSWPKRMGEELGRRLLSRTLLHVKPNKHLGDLTQRQRRRLATEIDRMLLPRRRRAREADQKAA